MPDGTIPTGSGELIQEFSQLQDILEENVPAYVLARTDATNNTWLFISYVPDTAKVCNYLNRKSGSIRLICVIQIGSRQGENTTNHITGQKPIVHPACRCCMRQPEGLLQRP